MNRKGRARNRGNNNGEPDPTLLGMMLSMGYTEGQAHIALVHTSGVAQAIEWLEAHPNAEEEAAVLQSSDSQNNSLQAENASGNSSQGMEDGLDDAAALKNWVQAGQSLRDSSAIETAVDSPQTPASADGSGEEASRVIDDGKDSLSRYGEPEATLAKMTSKIISTRAGSSEEEEKLLDLKPGMLVVETNDVGPLQVGATVRTGRYNCW